MLGKAPQEWQIYDAGHYQQCAKPIIDALTTNQDQIRALAAETLRLNGPLMPVLSAMGLIFSPQNPLMFGLSIETAYLSGTAIALYLVIAFLSKSTRVAMLGGLAVLCYLPAQAASAIFLTELPTAYLITVATALPAFILAQIRLGDTSRANQLAIGLGLTIGLIAMIKTALLPGLAVLTGCLLWQAFTYRKSCYQIISLILIGALSLSLLFGAVMMRLCGKFEPLPSRDPCMNMSIGCDLQVDGWECKPMPFVTQHYGFQKPLTTLAVTIKDHPLSFATMTARKLLREIDTPWISARRTSWWQLDWIPKAQHCVYLAFGLVGLALICKRTLLESFMPARKFLAGSSVLMILNHCIFVPFEAQPRYFFSAFGLLIVAAIVGFAQTSKKGRLIGMSVAVVMACIFMSTSGRDPFTSIDSKMLTEISLTTSPSAANTNQLYLINTRDTQDVTATIYQVAEHSSKEICTVDLHKCTAINQIQYPYRQVVTDMIAKVCHAKQIDYGDLWEWYLLPIPQTYNGKIMIKFSRPISVRLTSINTRENYQYIPAIIYRSLSHLESSFDGLDMRPPCQVSISRSNGQIAPTNQNNILSTPAIIAKSSMDRGNTNQPESIKQVPIYSVGLPANCSWH